MKDKPFSLVLCAVVFLAVKGASFAGLPGDFDLQAHRGGRDARPENTLPAFAYALAIGVTTLEMDIHCFSLSCPSCISM